ncbi:hypothetical protein Golob_018632 [Gossypium lobatum]|uniref:Uncharacterized protein n=2 Tax=Gossypium TaxID=3633 RepID=A0A7J8XK76_GOSAI|nr:hypothetical protein [Gossypium lobatum]MBA0687716.1 hypothetical protein [Gossypium aridum]
MMVGDYGNFSSLHFESKELDDEVGVPSSENDLLELAVSFDDRKKEVEQSKGKDIAGDVTCNYDNLGKVIHTRIGNCVVGGRDNFSSLTAFSDISMEDRDSPVSSGYESESKCFS